MNNNEWITDRLPTPQDGDYYGQVWDSTGGLSFTHEIAEGEPWMPSNCPGMYVKPKRVRVVQEQRYDDDGFEYAVTFGIGTVARHIPTREAAERIAAIYEEVMP